MAIAKEKMRLWLIVAVVATFGLDVLGQERHTVTSAVFAVDSRVLPARLANGTVQVGYAPSWSAGTDVSGACVVLERVDRPDTQMAVTSLVERFAADASGIRTISTESGKAEHFRLIHRTLLNEANVGVPLVADVAVGVPSDPGEAFVVDATCTNRLRTIAREHGEAPLTYSTAWMTGARSLKLALTGPSVTNVLQTFSAPATGEYAFGMVGKGSWRFLLMFLDENDAVIGTSLSHEFRLGDGFYFIIR